MRKSILLSSIVILFLFLNPNIWAGTKRALLIGIQDYRISGINSLNGPGNDLELIKQVLINRFQFNEQNIAKLMDSKASHTKLKTAFSALSNVIKKGDFVYIHYTGHGSRTRDLNGDEHPRKYDQTWVTYGSRSRKVKGDDQYDIIDDELYDWLTPIFEKTDHVVFVSDSCHSASVTRGNAPTVRAAAVDKRNYPLGEKLFKYKDFKTGIRIGAAQDAESAYEVRFDNGKIYGAFTWYWAEILQQAQPGDTWNDLFKRTSSKVTNRFSTQKPQIQGKLTQTVFGGKFKKASPRVPVSRVWNNGKKVRIEVGTLSGVTAGSIFRVYDPQQKDKSRLPTIEITKVTPFYSEASASSALQIGDLAVEENHAYSVKPIPVFINADDPNGADKNIISRLRQLFTGETPELSAYRLTHDQKICELVLYVLRPRRENGTFIKENLEDTLPKSFADQPPEVWVLNSGEKPISNDLHISFIDSSKGAELVITNLRKIARLKEIKNLTSGKKINIELNTTVWKPVKSPGKNKEDYLELPDNKGWLKKQGEYGPKEMETHPPYPPGTHLTFSVKNNTNDDYYIYLLDIMDNGKVEAIFPNPEDREEEALLPAGREWDLKEKVALLLNEPAEETIKLIVTQDPIDVSLLQQDEFIRRGGVKGSMNPLEQLLTSALHGTRAMRIRIKREQWGTLQYSIFVEKMSHLEKNSFESNNGTDKYFLFDCDN